MRILVAGASGSLGMSICEDLVGSGHEVTGTFFKKNEVQEQLPMVNWERVDLGDRDLTALFYSKNLNSDVLIYAAGNAPIGTIGSDVSFNELRLVQINLLSALAGANYLIPSMLERGFGRVIFLGSVVGKEGGVGLMHYSATKAALVGAVKSINREIRSLKHKSFSNADVTINSISPGYLESEMTRNIPVKVKEDLVRKNTSGRFLEVTEITRVVQFLLSPASGGICGSNLEIDGGLNP